VKPPALPEDTYSGLPASHTPLSISAVTMQIRSFPARSTSLPRTPFLDFPAVSESINGPSGMRYRRIAPQERRSRTISRLSFGLVRLANRLIDGKLCPSQPRASILQPYPHFWRVLHTLPEDSSVVIAD